MDLVFSLFFWRGKLDASVPVDINLWPIAKFDSIQLNALQYKIYVHQAREIGSKYIKKKTLKCGRMPIGTIFVIDSGKEKHSQNIKTLFTSHEIENSAN